MFESAHDGRWRDAGVVGEVSFRPDLCCARVRQLVNTEV